ncbi:DUF6009 family protein [Streptomyces roseolus]|uniref:DUF6009 family protein n=1 Tax=Streptomyces roseolus TaxID=67358 RepID=UPI00340E3691
MSSLIRENELKHETDPVRLEDVSRLDHVRQGLDRLPTRSGKPAHHRDGRRAGYAVLRTDAKDSRASGTFRRRVFWVRDRPRTGATGPSKRRTAA